jgi:hypothetical protein
LVNLGKNFTVTIPFPLEWGEIEEGKSPVQRLPEKVDVTIYGEGWVILSLKNRTPALKVDAQQGDVNVYEMIRVIMSNYPQASVTKVFPTSIQVQLDKKIVRKVPVRPLVELQFAASHNAVQAPVLLPDSVAVTGAKMLVEQIKEWQSLPVTIRGIKSDVQTVLPLAPPDQALYLSHQAVQYKVAVAEFTEGEVRVPIKLKGSTRQVTFSPATISVRYDVPVGDYADTQEKLPFEAWVNWEEIASDSSGFASPTILDVSRNPNIQLRGFQPRRVAYYFTIRPGVKQP